MRFFSAIIRAVLASVTLATLVGCAHPINIGGDTRPERIESELIQKKVAYAISETQRNTAFVSPAGGGTVLDTSLIATSKKQFGTHCALFTRM
ncbi:hypothetical protein [Delftia sp. 60]|uniref:hypothetical protein n=1 Tax=Delftia sp. 60 TaxID=2035216 RepID=UPI00211ECFE0|nr:hypothetical protein [Delftia sp. 60]